MIHIGTSGWHYDHWRGPFYPKKLPKKDFLEFYAGHFHTVEINNSFYQLPKKETLQTWMKNTPPDFIFTAKASRYITHMKNLKDSENSLKSFMDKIEVLGEKLGPILFQLPPRWNFNPERFYDFLETLHGQYRYAFEFRNSTWHDDRVYEAMKEIGAAFCVYDLDGHLSPKEITTDFIYVRLHGPKKTYKGQYDTKFLSGWAGSFTAWSNQGMEIFCYFDNDGAGYAIQDALKLQKMFKH